MSISSQELRSAIEAILFISGEPVRIDDLRAAFPDAEESAIEAELAEIERKLAESGFHLERSGGGFRFATRPDLDPLLRKFFSKRGEGRLSVASLETLAIVAYRQPITAPEISEIRGVNSSGVLRTLLERKLIRIAGRKNVVGSPFLYRTTREFLIHFGLDSIQDLPRIEEFAEILGENVGDDLLDPIETGSVDAGIIEHEAFDGDSGEAELIPSTNSPEAEGISVVNEESPAAAQEPSAEEPTNAGEGEMDEMPEGGSSV
jgi:segregation and condensation protein B